MEFFFVFVFWGKQEMDIKHRNLVHDIFFNIFFQTFMQEGDPGGYKGA
jgi:hypothetical protein